MARGGIGIPRVIQNYDPVSQAQGMGCSYNRLELLAETTIWLQSGLILTLSCHKNVNHIVPSIPRQNRHSSVHKVSNGTGKPVNW